MDFGKFDEKTVGKSIINTNFKQQVISEPQKLLHLPINFQTKQNLHRNKQWRTSFFFDSHQLMNSGIPGIHFIVHIDVT